MTNEPCARDAADTAAHAAEMQQQHSCSEQYTHAATAHQADFYPQLTDERGQGEPPDEASLTIPLHARPQAPLADRDAGGVRGPAEGRLDVRD